MRHPPNVTQGKLRPRLAHFYGPTPFAGSAHLDVHGVGVREWMRPAMVDRPRGTEDVLLMVFHRPVCIGVDGSDVECPASTLLVWQPHAPHRYGNPDALWLHSWIHADGAVLHRHLRLNRIPLDVPISGIDPEWIEEACWAIHREVGGEPAPDPLIVENILSTLLRRVARAMGARRAIAVPPQLARVRRWLEERFHEPVVLADLARRCEWSIWHFCARFKAAYGVSAIDMVVRLRLGHARALLRDPSMTVAAAARAVGYDDVRTFAKLVRRQLGCSPSGLRR
jgi:AraC family transcriptional regulator of arabinose operon